MKDTILLLLAGLLFVAVLSPVLALYAMSLIIHVAVVNPLLHVYRIFRYGIQYDPLESL